MRWPWQRPAPLTNKQRMHRWLAWFCLLQAIPVGYLLGYAIGEVIARAVSHG